MVFSIVVVFFSRSVLIRPSLGFRRRIFLLNPLNRLVAIILHHPFFLEVFHLSQSVFHNLKTGTGTGTHPSLRASPLKLLNFLPAFCPRTLVVPHGVEDVIPVQAGEEPIATFPAAFARGSIGGYAAAVGGGCIG